MRELHYAYNWMTAAFVPSAAQLARYHASEAERIRILDGEPPPDTSAELERLTAEMEARRKTGKVMKRFCDMSVGTNYGPGLIITRIEDKQIYISHDGSKDGEILFQGNETLESEIISEPTPEVGDTVQCLKDDVYRSGGLWDRQIGQSGELLKFEDHVKYNAAVVSLLTYNWPLRSLRIIKKKGM